MFRAETIINNINRKEIILCDWDGVIQDLDFKWLGKVINEIDFYDKYFNMNLLKDKDGNWNLENSHRRNIYYMNKWLEEGRQVPKEVDERFVELYMGDPTFYFDCPFLTMANAIKTLEKESFVDEIVFISAAPVGYTTDPRKLAMQREFFGDSKKIKLEIVPNDEPKSKYINEHHPNYTVFIDDRSDTVRDVINNTNSSGKRFILPAYGYNLELGMDKDYINEISKREITVSTYDNEFI